MLLPAPEPHPGRGSAGSPPHAGACPWVPGSLRWLHLAPSPQEFATETEKPRRETRILLPPVRLGGGCLALSRGPSPTAPMPQGDVPEPRVPAAFQPWPRTPRRPNKKQNQLAGMLTAEGGELPSPVRCGLTASAAGWDPPGSLGLETLCSWLLPGASATWPSGGRSPWSWAWCL